MGCPSGNQLAEQGLPRMAYVRGNDGAGFDDALDWHLSDTFGNS
jgi:hypothetical protein